MHRESIGVYGSYEVKTDEDIEQTAALAFEIWHEYWKDLLPYEQIVYMLEEFQSFDAIKKQIVNDGHVYKILKHGNEIAGYFGVCKESQRIEYLLLSKLYIKKEYRGKGVGRCAFKEIKNLAKLKNLSTIRLCVNRHNINSVRAYEKWGFKIISTCARDLGQNFVGDDYIMEFKCCE